MSGQNINEISETIGNNDEARSSRHNEQGKDTGCVAVSQTEQKGRVIGSKPNKRKYNKRFISGVVRKSTRLRKPVDRFSFV